MNQQVFICSGKTCSQRGSRDLFAIAKRQGINAETCGCMKQCQRGPNIRVRSGASDMVKNGMTEERFEHYLGSLKKGKVNSKKTLNSLLSSGF